MKLGWRRGQELGETVIERGKLHNAQTREGFTGASTFSEVVRQGEVHLFKAGGGEEWSRSFCECPTRKLFS